MSVLWEGLRLRACRPCDHVLDALFGENNVTAPAVSLWPEQLAVIKEK